MNKVEISGIVSNEPEIFYSPSGLCVMNLNIITDKQSKQVSNEQIAIVAYGNTAEINKRLIKKEMEIAVYGKLQSRNYTTVDGENKTAVEIIAEKIEILKQKMEE